MDTVPYRDLRNMPGKVREKLKEGRDLLVTSDGDPIAVMISVKDEDLGETLELVQRLRAQQAVRRLRAEAQERGLDRLSAEEIEAEIEAVRRER